MSTFNHRSLAALTTLLLLAACATPPGTPGNDASGGTGAKKVSPAKSALPGLPGTSGAGQAILRAIPQSINVVQLTGKAKLISDQGGSLISDQGGSLISNNSAGIISNNTGNLIGKAKWSLLQARAPEFLLADAVVTVHDAAGRQLVDDKGQPLQGITDQQGNFTFKATLPDENLILRITLWNGGQLMAIAPRQTGAERTVDLNTSSTLGASYILERFVRGEQATFDKLPASEADRLKREMDAAVALLTAPPSYQVQDSVELAEGLRAKAPSLNATLKDIEVLLLGGLGDGRQADSIGLNRPRALLLASSGELYIAEDDFGRIRRVNRDGTITTFADGRGGLVPDNFPRLTGLAEADGGALYVASRSRRRVYLATAGQAPQVVVGNGQFEAETFKDGNALEIGLTPYAVAYDRTRKILWVAQRQETEGSRYLPDRLFQVDAQGTLRSVALPPNTEGQAISALALNATGDLYLLQGKSLFRRTSNETWIEEIGNLGVQDGGLAVAADGTVVVCEDLAAQVRVRKPGGAFEALPMPSAGPLQFRRPNSAAVGSDGIIYVADRASNLVVAFDASGQWRRVAGVDQTNQLQRDEITLNSPAGVAYDAQDRLLVTEGGGHAIRRLDGTTLSTIAGGTVGFSGDGGPAEKASFNTPASLVFHQGSIYVADVANDAIRVIDPTGVITTRIGGNAGFTTRGFNPREKFSAKAIRVDRTAHMAIGPDGSIYWTSIRWNQVYHCSPSGEVRLLAGSPQPLGTPQEGADGPAHSVALGAPFGLAFKPGEPDNLYFSEVINCRVRRIVGITGDAPVVETVAGLGRIGTVVKVAQPAGWEAAEQGIRATEAALVGPTAIAFDAKGTMYVSEGGSGNVSNFADVSQFAGDLNLPKTAARIRTIDAQGIIRTLAGPGGKLHPDPNDPDGIGLPSALAFDSKGNLAVVDMRNNSVRIISAETLR